MFLIGYGEGEPSAHFDTFQARAEVESVSNGALSMKSSAKQKVIKNGLKKIKNQAISIPSNQFN